MATPNYSYEKRQRELAKKRKKEEKLKRKAAGGDATEAESPDAATDGAAPTGETPPQGGSSTP